MDEIKPETLVAPRSYHTNQGKNPYFSLFIDAKTKLLEYSEDDELDIDIPTSVIPAMGHFEENKGNFENMRCFDLGK